MFTWKKEVEKNQFQARSSAGKEYTVIEYEDLLLTHSRDEKNSGKLGPSRYKTSSGEDLTRLDSKRFKINTTNEIIQIV